MTKSHYVLFIDTLCSHGKTVLVKNSMMKPDHQLTKKGMNDESESATYRYGWRSLSV